MGEEKLAKYNAKRDFAKTAEPAGKPGRKSGNTFIVQKHAASRLHWDFRLELDGVLLSWAVTKPPTADPAVKRLAVRTEDHPLGYATFEGTISKGEYGGGTVMLWDRGTWENESDPREGLAKGKLHFTLTGERMRGEWVLIRLKPEGKAENWLLGKIADDFAGGDLDADTSVATGRTMAAIATATAEEKKGIASPPLPSSREGSGVGRRPARKPPARQRAAPRGDTPTLDPSLKQGGAKSQPPPFRDPQLATLVDTPPTGNDWLHETKYDGYRALVAVGGGRAIAYSRSGLDWTEKFGTVPAACAPLPCASALIDGEIVALDADGKPSFTALKDALGNGGPLLYFAFDLLALDGDDLAALPLTTRKEKLAALLDGAPPPLHYSEHVRGGGEAMFAALCGAGYEGVVSKRADGKSRPGRSGGWQKSKCTRRQEFVIGGWSASGKGRGFASILVGVQEEGGLRYAGRVGTGFDDATLTDLTKRFAKLAADKSPFAEKLPALARRGAHFVRPELVAEIAFAEFTGEGSVRHGSFLGLREDKKPADVARQTALPAPDLHGVTISSPDRIVFPELGLTKAALAAYYATLSDPMLKLLAGRPISLVRCPQGRAKACFFQKHDSGMFADSVHHVDIAESEGKTEPYLYVDDAAGLLACVQMGTIEFHGWGSLVADIERPDRLVIDLDPDEGLGFDVVRSAAALVRDRLKAAGLASAPMLTGGKGVHVVAPLVPDAEWPAVKAWARNFAEAMAADMPDAFVATMSKAKRKGRIFVDWLRNQRGATAVLPYSVRARDGAGVAVPLTWAQLAETISGNAFTAADPAAVLAQSARPAEKIRAKKLPK